MIGGFVRYLPWLACRSTVTDLCCSLPVEYQLHPGYLPKDGNQDLIHPRSSGWQETGELGWLAGMVGGYIQTACNGGERTHQFFQLNLLIYAEQHPHDKLGSRP